MRPVLVVSKNELEIEPVLMPAKPPEKPAPVTAPLA